MNCTLIKRSFGVLVFFQKIKRKAKYYIMHRILKKSALILSTMTFLAFAPFSKAIAQMIPIPETSFENEILALDRSVNQLNQRIARSIDGLKGIDSIYARLSMTIDTLRSTNQDAERYRKGCMNREQRYVQEPSSFGLRSYKECIDRYKRILELQSIYVSDIERLTLQISEINTNILGENIADLRASLDAKRDILTSLSSTSELPSIYASRIFLPPHRFPPKEFAAYGIIVFKDALNSHNIEKYLMICNAYVSSLLPSNELDVSADKQMATIWPIKTNKIVRKITIAGSTKDKCEIAVRNYDLKTSLDAIIDAEEAGLKLNSNGPYLLAWSPAITKGQKDAIVLYFDLSNVTSYEGAIEIFSFWGDKIEKDSELWQDGFDIEKTRIIIKLFLDKYGRNILDIVKGG